MKAKTFLVIWRALKSRRDAEGCMRRLLAHANGRRAASCANS